MQILIDMITKKVSAINQEKKILNYVIESPNINPIKTVKQTLTKQKINENGQLLYLKIINKDDPYKKKELEVAFPYEQINNEIFYYSPILEEFEVDFHYSLNDNPTVFDFDDIVKAKGEALLKNTNFNNVLLFEELDEKNISIDLSSNLANTGIKLISILPDGQCRTTKITLPQPTDKIGIYLEADPDITVEVGNSASNFISLVNGVVQFDSPTSYIYIKFKNPNGLIPQDIRAYGVFY